METGYRGRGRWEHSIFPMPIHFKKRTSEHFKSLSYFRRSHSGPLVSVKCFETSKLGRMPVSMKVAKPPFTHTNRTPDQPHRFSWIISVISSITGKASWVILGVPVCPGKTCLLIFTLRSLWIKNSPYSSFKAPCSLPIHPGHFLSRRLRPEVRI